MIIIRKLACASAFVLAALATTANAATISITGPASVNVGDIFDLQITGDFGTDSFSNGGLTALWDDPLMDLQNIALNLAGTDPSFSCPGTNPACTPTASSASVAWGTFGGALIAANAGPTLMATLTFQAVAGGTANFNLIDAGQGWLDGGFGAIATPTFNGASVVVNSTVVPVPAAVWLFGSGLIGLVGVARRRTAA